MSRVGSYTDKIVAVASGLQISIPFLAFSIMQGGVGGFIHLAGNITGATQSAAAAAANEQVTGNKSFDNYSVGNQQLYNSSGFKTDWQQSYAAGGGSYQHMDGTQERVTGLGNMLLQSGTGLTASSGETTYRYDDNRHAQVSEGVQASESLHQQGLRSLSHSKANTISRTADFVAQIAQREHSGETFNYEKMGEQGKALQQAVNHTTQLHDKKGYGWDQAAKTSVEATANYGTPSFMSLTGVSASVGVKGDVSASNSSNQSVGEDVIINRDHHTSQNYHNLVRAASNSSWAREHSVDTSYSDAVRSSYEEQQRLEQQVSISQQRVDDWHRAASVINSQGASSSKEMFQEVADRVQQNYSVDSTTAHHMVSKNSPEAQRVWREMQNVQDVVKNISSGRSKVSGDGATAKLDQFTNQHAGTINDNPAAIVQQHAANNAMNIENIKSNIQSSKNNISDQYDKITDKNAVQHHSVQTFNEQEEKDAKQQVRQYEKDRIGQGKMAKGMGKAINIVTVGNSGDSIGKPNDKK